ncbi:recombinase family protein [Acidisphaera sp. S103]|uniref:recombinase family protein n=1 Tax=Acidisphaera sp. S103 TaxID=1747223 RepID=UPI00352CE8D6
MVSSATTFTIHILAVVAEHKREMIPARTKAALAQVKAQGKRRGNPRPSKRSSSPTPPRQPRSLCSASSISSLPGRHRAKDWARWLAN